MLGNRYHKHPQPVTDRVRLNRIGSGGTVIGRCRTAVQIDLEDRGTVVELHHDVRARNGHYAETPIQVRHGDVEVDGKAGAVAQLHLNVVLAQQRFHAATPVQVGDQGGFRDLEADIRQKNFKRQGQQARGGERRRTACEQTGQRFHF